MVKSCAEGQHLYTNNCTNKRGIERLEQDHSRPHVIYLLVPITPGFVTELQNKNYHISAHPPIFFLSLFSLFLLSYHLLDSPAATLQLSLPSSWFPDISFMRNPVSDLIFSLAGALLPIDTVSTGVFKG